MHTILCVLKLHQKPDSWCWKDSVPTILIFHSLYLVCHVWFKTTLLLRQHCWTRGGNPSDMIFGPTVHSVISVARSRTMQHAVPDVIGYYFNKRVGPILGRGDEIREEGHSHLEVIWVCAAYKTHLFTLISSSGDPQFHVNLPLRSPTSQFSPKKF